MRQRDIFLFWLPLFASWLLMTAEGPILSAATNRLPNETIMLAAQGIVISLAVFIESPIIQMLATSTALVNDRATYMLVRRYTVHWMIGLTVISVLLAFTPLFDVVVRGWLETPDEIAMWVQPGLQIMVLWSAAIAWRRFQQGVMIHFGHTRLIAWGTAIRLVASASVVVGLAVFTDWAAVINAACAWMAGVIAEAIYATIAVRPILSNELKGSEDDEPPITYSELWRFHMPLAGTSILILFAQPLVTSSLARLENPTQSLAAWPVLFQMMLIARAAAFALPEVVIALTKTPEMFKPIRQFSLRMATITTTLMVVLIVTPLSSFYIFGVQDMMPITGQLIEDVLPLFLLFPALAVLASWLRGLLIKNKTTSAVNWGMVINVVITAVVLLVGLNQRWSGLSTAAIALNLAAFAELLYLGWRTWALRTGALGIRYAA